MKVWNVKILAMTLTVLIALCGVVFNAHADGKQIFLDGKCNKCHEGAGIKLLPKDPAAESADEDAEEEGVKKVDPPKLDGIGAKILETFGGTSDAAMTKLPPFLRKEVAIESGEFKGKKHKKKNKLTDEQFKELIPWLLKL